MNYTANPIGEKGGGDKPACGCAWLQGRPWKGNRQDYIEIKMQLKWITQQIQLVRRGAGGGVNRHVVAPNCEGGLEKEIVKIIMELQCNLNALHSKYNWWEGGGINRHVVAPNCEEGHEKEIVKIIMELQCNWNGLPSKSNWWEGGGGKGKPTCDCT